MTTLLDMPTGHGFSAPINTAYAEVGRRLRQARQDAGYATLRQASTAEGGPVPKSHATIGRHEDGTSKVGIDDLVGYSDAYQVSAQWLAAPLLGEPSGDPTDLDLVERAQYQLYELARRLRERDRAEVTDELARRRTP